MDFNRAKSVDFSSFLSTDYYTIIIPLSTENDIWSFFGPFDYEIWVLFILSVPIMISAMALANFPRDRKVKWSISVDFVLRNTLSESFPRFWTLDKIWWKKNYQQILALIWIWSCFVLIKSYEGNLTAMITRPKLRMKYSILQDFLDNSEITLVTEEEATPGLEYWRKAPIYSTERQIIDQTEMSNNEEEWPSSCFAESAFYSRRHASICDINSILTHLSDDFTENGKCNWYMLKQDFFHATLVMAFQVY